MLSRFVPISLSICLGCIAASIWPLPSTADDNSPERLGYFTAAFPEVVSRLWTKEEQRLKEEAERQLRKYSGCGNPPFTRPKVVSQEQDLEMRTRLEQDISNRRSEVEYVITRSQMARESALRAAVLAVAKERGLQVVVDESRVFRGLELLRAQGENVTEAVINHLPKSLQMYDKAPPVKCSEGGEYHPSP